MQIVIDIPEEEYQNYLKMRPAYPEGVFCYIKAIQNGTPLPKGHGRLKDEDEIIKAIEDRVEFLRKNDAIFMRLRKDIDILGCIPKIRCEVSTIIEADKAESKIHCTYTNEEIAKSFIEDVESVKDLLPMAESEEVCAKKRRYGNMKTSG